MNVKTFLFKKEKSFKTFNQTNPIKHKIHSKYSYFKSINKITQLLQMFLANLSPKNGKVSVNDFNR